MGATWTVKDLLDWTAKYFRKKGILEPRLEAELLLANVLGQGRVSLYVNYHQPVNPEERARYRELIQRRARGEPAAYLIGQKEFFSLDFHVNRNVLIPRPDTEVLVETAINLARSIEGPLRIADVGTGSGVIAVTLAVYLSEARVFAIDICSTALQVAGENARKHDVADRVTCLAGDMLAPLLETGTCLEMIVANLPYIPTSDLANLPPDVYCFEPKLALDGGDNGLGLYRRLIPQACQCLKNGGYLLLEIDPRQALPMMSMMEAFAEVSVIKDLAGRDRVIVGQKGEG